MRDSTQGGRRWRNRQLVREPDPHHARRLWRVAVCMVLATGPVVAYLVQQNECLKLAYETNALRVETDALVEQERRLRVERASLAAPEAIERWASNDSGMVPPAPDRVVVVDRGAVPPGELLALDANHPRRLSRGAFDNARATE